MGWEKVKLKNVLKQYRFTTIVEDNIEYKQVTISKHNGVSFRGFKLGKEIGRKRQFRINLKEYPNTLMLVRQGIQDGSIGIAPALVDGCIATENMPMFAVENINIDFLKIIINSPYFNEELAKISTTGSAQKSIHEREILEIEIPFPAENEQMEFVQNYQNFDGSGQKIKTELTAQLSLVKQLRQAFLSDAMQGKLCQFEPLEDQETGQQLLARIKAEKAQLMKDKKLKKEKELSPIKLEDIPFEIPKDWVWCRLGEIALYSEGGKSYQANEISAGINEIGVIKTSALTSGVFKEDKNKLLPNQNVDIQNILIHEGDMIFCRASGSKGLAGKSCIVFEIPKAKLILSDKSIRYVFSNNIENRYIQYFNSSLFVDEYYRKLATNKSTSMNNITRPQFNSLPIPLPPLSIQNQIVAKLDELMKTCDDLEKSIKQSQLQSEQLLQQVLKEALEVR